jgi:transcriptional regulator with XRE-family HTH domain
MHNETKKTMINMQNAKPINRLKVVLVEQNRTGKWLAETIGKNDATVSRWCSNVIQPPLEMLVKIAQVLNVDVRELLNSTK